MKPKPEPPSRGVAGFRWKLTAAIMLVVTSIAGTALWLAERQLTASAEAELQEGFQNEFASLDRAQAVLRAALVERCRALVRKPRIRAAFEDDALDLLYPNAEDELRDVVARGPGRGDEVGARRLQGRFYRFLDRKGAIIPPPNSRPIGALAPEEEAKLALPQLPIEPQLGFLPHADGRLSEILAMPIISSDTGEAIAALVLGFPAFGPEGDGRHASARSGIWLGDRLHNDGRRPETGPALERALRGALPETAHVELESGPHLVFAKVLNADSLYPRAHEVRAYPLAELAARRSRLRWQVVGFGGLLLAAGLAGSHLVSIRLAAPVERLASDSETDRARRAVAEAALEVTSAELQRSARFSADASHQLKTPVTVLRVGLEEMLARKDLSPEECRALSDLIHQTFRLSSLIEDLLLLSRLDAGRLALQVGAVDLSLVIASALDDLGAQPDPFGLAVETEFPPGLGLAGERRYVAMIVQNLLENARKYNRAGGRIRLAATAAGGVVRLTVGNTGATIAPEAQTRIFERFHRGAMGENVPGYGLGLNLARELARLHGGDLRLLRSADDWTEFEASFRQAGPSEGVARA